MKVLENLAQPVDSLSMNLCRDADNIYVLPTQPSIKNTLELAGWEPKFWS